MATRYTVPEIRRDTDVTVIFHCGLRFALLPPHNLKIEKLKKLKNRTTTTTKTTWRYYHFTQVYHKS